ncbi:MAG: tyrosine recombinase [Bacilli bacterium]|nr:tyrosine recombinase [Bacilli bacterium]
MKYINKYLKYLKVIKKDSNYTITSYQNDLLELYDFNQDLLNIDENDVKEYLEYLYERKLNRNSIARKISSIRGFYQYLEGEGIIKNNYFKEVTSPKKNESLPKYVKNNDIEKMFLSFDKTTPLGQRNALILEMLYATGIRVGELVNIKINDINLYDRTIKIFGKGRKERIVVYGSYCQDALELYLNDGRRELEKRKNEYLFLNKNGNRLSDRYIRKIIDDIVIKCEMDYHISPHTLRHTFATDMLNNGADLMTVKELLGHSSINTTGIYTHVSNEQLKKVYQFAHPRSKE